MEKQKTAVEWQFEQLFNSFEKFNNGEYSFNDYLKKNLEIREQAKQMEKERMKEIMWDLTDVDMTKTNKGLIIDNMFKQYYQSKYGKDE